MSIYDIPVNDLHGEPVELTQFKGKALLIVNVASKCGLTPQYTGLEKIHEELKDQGFSVLGVPCNQFGGQEPGTTEEIAVFCSATYGVSFPMTEKVDVNGEDRHEIFRALVEVPNEKGETGDVTWNFEKFLVAADGSITRFGPTVTPEDPALVAAIEDALPS
jgi:glutathione peroxidase